MITKEKKLSRKEQKALALAQEQEKLDSLEQEKRKQAAIVLAKKKAEEAAEELRLEELRRKTDSLEAVAKERQNAVRELTTDEQPKKGERFEEAVLTEDIRPGYYLIVNVFGTQRYYNSFMKSLAEKGLNPKSFYRTEKKHNYVYLERYDTMQEARKARDSKFFGKYSESIWIFRVKSE